MTAIWSRTSRGVSGPGNKSGDNEHISRPGLVAVTPRIKVTDIVTAREMAAAGFGVAILTHAACTAVR